MQLVASTEKFELDEDVKVEHERVNGLNLEADNDHRLIVSGVSKVYRNMLGHFLQFNNSNRFLVL